MGLIVNENYVAANGVQKQGVYISFNNETIYLRKDGGNGYKVHANCRIFWDKDAKDEGKSFLELKSISASLSAEELNTNLYTCLYNELKKTYVNSVDAI